MNCENVLLVVPVRKGYSQIAIDLGILYLYSALKRERIAATILHCPKENIDFDRFEEILKNNRHVKIIGFKSYSVDHNPLKMMSRIVKKIIPDCATIAGGPHPTSLPEYILKDIPHMDYVYCGEAEIGFPVFCKNILGEQKADDVPGIAFRSEGTVRMNPNKIYENLDDLPRIDWPAINIKEYTKFTTSLQFVPVMATRGCPYECKYCAGHKIVGRKIRYRSPDNVVDELKILHQLGIKEINFSDDELTLNKKYFMELCGAIIRSKLNMRWECSNGVRLDTLDDEVLDLMYDAGCRYIAVGIESSSNKILKDMKKGITVETIAEKIKLIKRHKVIPQGLFMIGFPDESEEDIKNTIKFALELDIDKTNFSIFMPLPGSEIFEELTAQKEIKLEDINWDDMKPDHVVWSRTMPAERLKKLQKTAYFRFYLRPGPIRRMLKENLLNMSGWKTAVLKLKSIFYN